MMSSLKARKYMLHLTNQFFRKRLIPCDHEEADTRLLLHLIDTLNKGQKSCLVRTVDTDVGVILIGKLHRLLHANADADIWVAFGWGKHFTYGTSIMHNYNDLGEQKSLALPPFHSFIGCDTTSAFHGRGNKLAWEAWNCYPEVTTAFTYMASNLYASLVLESPHYRLLERFTIVLYNKTSNLEDVDEARMELFCQRSRSMENIPPTRDTLLHHAKRAVYQASVWATSEQIQQNRLSPETWVWQWDKDTKSWTPVWTTSPIASKACLELINVAAGVQEVVVLGVDAKKPILCVLNSCKCNCVFHCNYIFAF